MTKPQMNRRNSATSESAKEDPPLQEGYPPLEETLIANTTPSGKDTGKQTLGFNESSFSSYGGAGKAPKLTFKKSSTRSSDEEGATSDQKDNDSIRSSKHKTGRTQRQNKRSKGREVNKQRNRRPPSYYDSSSPSSSSTSEDSDSENDDKD